MNNRDIIKRKLDILIRLRGYLIFANDSALEHGSIGKPASEISRAETEEEFGLATTLVSQLKTLLANASEYKGKQLEAEQKQARENAARGRLKGLGML